MLASLVLALLLPEVEGLAADPLVIAYIHHIANSIRIAEIVERAAETRTAIDESSPTTSPSRWSSRRRGTGPGRTRPRPG
ncbi:MAG: DUF2254 domain-containing protein [Pseudonocardia sp.]|nr:DUF2254 domain-containing protein [Pseudonocardia sp.]